METEMRALMPKPTKAQDRIRRQSSLHFTGTFERRSLHGRQRKKRAHSRAVGMAAPMLRRRGGRGRGGGARGQEGEGSIMSRVGLWGRGEGGGNGSVRRVTSRDLCCGLLLAHCGISRRLHGGLLDLPPQAPL